MIQRNLIFGNSSKKIRKKNLKVASNLDDVFHIVFMATDRFTTKNQKVGAPDLSTPTVEKKIKFLIYCPIFVCGYENDVEYII